MRVAAASGIIAGLYFAAPLLVPIALAILISFAVAPLVARLERWHFGRFGSILTVILLGGALAAGTVLLVVGQAADLMTRLPAYRGNLSRKFEVVRNLDRKWAQASGELALASEDPDSAVKPEASQPPNPARLRASEETRNFNPLRDGLARSIEFLLAAGGVVILVIFILLQRQDLLARALRVAGGGRFGVTSQALNETADKLSRYLLAEASLNAIYGAVITIGLYFLGIPNAFIWGLLSFLLRFAPYIGPILAAAMPVGLTLAISQSWTLPLATAAFFVGVELVVNNIVEPLVYGRKTGLSPVAILAAAAFWTWLWGVPGLILATPLTVCLFVFAKHFPPLHFFHVLMGQEVDRSLAARLYPRLLASDHDAVADAVSEERLRSGLAEGFDATLVPVLELVKRNRREGELDLDESLRIVRDIEEISEEAAEEAKAGATAPVVPALDVLCIPAKDDADAACCRMLIRVLELAGFAARLGRPDASTEADSRNPNLLCLVDVRPSSPRRLRFLAAKLRARFPDVPVLAARLPANGADEGLPAAVSPLLHSASTIEECREVVKRLLAPLKEPVAAPPPVEVGLPVPA
ncbi:MAG: AI-2E family transporter [Planctomycetota bacterium]